MRLRGQDSCRGTFSQRHAVLVDQENEQRYVPLNHVRDGQAQFEVLDSPLSEAAVLGFEYGYSLAEPHALVMWEAQFGDFANGAQVIIDQFIASGEAKWLRMSGLTMLLPHGYEGQGPEHSSARLERYLAALRRGQHPGLQSHHLGQLFPRAAPPGAAQFPQAADRDDAEIAAARARGRVAACPRWARAPRSTASSTRSTRSPRRRKYAASCCAAARSTSICAKARREKKIDDVAILRLEQLYPFPARSFAQMLARYPNAELVWCQEEPENMGAWSFLDRRIEKALATIDIKMKRARYVGRPEAAATATGLMRAPQRRAGAPRRRRACGLTRKGVPWRPRSWCPPWANR